MIDEIKKIKKVELHLHLDGSVSIDTLHKLSNIEFDKLKEQIIAKDKCENLTEYLTKFQLPLSFMQESNNLKLIASDLVKYLEEENVIYAEIRFAPKLHTQNGLTLDEIVNSVLEGLKESKVKINLILCMMRHFTFKENLETIEIAKKYLNKGVCAIDLAGDENKYPLDNFIDLFKIAKEQAIPYTIHAGENGSYKEVLKAINLGSKRIGHGVHAIESERIQQLIKEKDILLEICPTSNVQTNTIDIYKNHPIYKFYKDGIKICINTDNKTVSNISLTNEYIKLYNTFNFSNNDFIKMNKYAIEKAFISEQEKKELLEELLK